MGIANYFQISSPIYQSKSTFSVEFVYFTFFVVAEYIVDGVPTLLRWAMNNISTIHAHDPLIGKAVDTARNLGWPSSIEDTVEVPKDIPFTQFDWTGNITGPDGPGAPLGTMEESIMQFTKDEVVEIVLQNTRSLNGAPEFHPWHMHGYSFWIVGQGEGNYDASVHVSTYNLVNPLLRDTVVLQPLSWVALRFVADNPGAWFFHCHIMSHHVMGMGFTMIVQPDELGEVPVNVRSCTDSSLNETEPDEPSTNETDSGSDDSSDAAARFMFGFYSTVFGTMVVSSTMVMIVSSMAYVSLF